MGKLNCQILYRRNQNDPDPFFNTQINESKRNRLTNKRQKFVSQKKRHFIKKINRKNLSKTKANIINNQVNSRPDASFLKQLEQINENPQQQYKVKVNEFQKKYASFIIKFNGRRIKQNLRVDQYIPTEKHQRSMEIYQDSKLINSRRYMRKKILYITGLITQFKENQLLGHNIQQHQGKLLIREVLKCSRLFQNQLNIDQLACKLYQQCIDSTSRRDIVLVEA